MRRAVLVEVLGPADPAPEGVELLRSRTPPGYDLIVVIQLGEQAVCMASRAPARALAAAHAAAELVEAHGHRPRLVLGADGRRLVAAAARDVARQEEDGAHRRLVDEMHPRWEMALSASTSLLPTTRH